MSYKDIITKHGGVFDSFLNKQELYRFQNHATIQKAEEELRQHYNENVAHIWSSLDVLGFSFKQENRSVSTLE